jgi:hypothetical protein
MQEGLVGIRSPNKAQPHPGKGLHAAPHPTLSLRRGKPKAKTRHQGGFSE